MSAPDLEQLALLRLTRRDFVRLGSITGLSALLGASLAGCNTPGASLAGYRAASTPRFKSVPLSSADRVAVPPGYSSRVLYAWGDPISDGPAYRPDASNSADEQRIQAGMHHDGMHFFPLPAGSGHADRGLLVLNHEYLDQNLLFTDGMKTWNSAKLLKAQYAVGVSVIEIRRQGGQWQVVRPSPFARRIHSLTPMSIGGPARGNVQMRTAADPAGIEVFGTHSNCANGFTPWGTYLTCEENIQNHFADPSGNITPRQARYALRRQNGYRWYELDERFDTGRHPNEYHRFGWVVEIDPFEPDSKPVKRTALGRCFHESAFHAVAADGRIVIYTGDDSRFEYIYKFVSRDPWNPRDRAANRELLDHGTLYVGRFNDDGSGTWLPLAHGECGLTTANGFADQADVLIHARQAGDQAGGTRMDRPEWIVIHPQTGEVYASLTHNDQRGTAGNPGTNGANPRERNVFGQIIRWREAGGDAASLTFSWDLFVLAGDPAHPDRTQRGNIRGDAFACPDTLRFSPDGTLWIGTDTSTGGRGVYAGLGNNQLLAAATATGEIRRFLTGPRGCEITGLTFTPDGRTAYLNIQHPGEASEDADGERNSSWPSGVRGARPRSATIVITKDDGGIIGT